MKGGYFMYSQNYLPYNYYPRSYNRNNRFFAGGFVLPFAAGLLAAPLVYRPYPYYRPYQPYPYYY